MDKSNNVDGDRTFRQLTSDEKSIITGVIARDICIATISELTNSPKMLVQMWLKQQIVEALKVKSPVELQRTINRSREIDR